MPEGESPLIVANLDCDGDFARLHGGPPESPRSRLSRAARRRIETLAPLLSCLGGGGTRLVPDADAYTGTAPAILAWAETTAVADLRERGHATPIVDPTASAHGANTAERGWLERLWSIDPPRPAAVAEVNHRGFAHDLRAGLCDLPGSRLVDSIAEVERSTRGRLPSDASGWVLKAPFSSSGRRFVFVDEDGPREAQRARIERSVEAYGPCLLEPWMEREADFGCCGLVDETGFEIVSVHRLRIDRRGVFRGLELARDATRPPGLLNRERDDLLESATLISRALVAAGYRGPFGVDAWRYRTQRGPGFCSLGEINARLTFGFVGRRLFEILYPDGPPDQRAVFRIGGGMPPDRATILGPGAWIARV